MSTLSLSPWYINTRRLSVLTKQNLGTGAQVTVTANDRSRVDAMHQAYLLSQALIDSGKVPLLAELIAKGRFPGDVLAATWANAIFAGAPDAIRSSERGRPVKKPTVSVEIVVGGRVQVLKGALEIEHFYSSSSLERLSGRRQFYFVGEFQLDLTKEHAEFFPIVIGDLIEPVGALRMSWPSNADVHPGLLDAFAKMLKVRPPANGRLLEIMRSISEANVKRAFAQIIGEPFVPKDWAGERSDLFSNRVTIDGVPTTAAFLLKGPAVPGPMHPADLGARGDQIVRLFDEPAELLVIQHCNKIETTVVKMMRQFAIDPRHPRKYCIIDGGSTYSILKAYGYIDGDGVFTARDDL